MAEASSSSPSKTRERKSKSVVLMREITALRDQGKKLKVEFDSDDLPIGKIGSKFTSYVGLLGRSKVPITIPTWKHVGDDLKLKIWDDVLTVFDIPETKTKQKQVISIANSTWTNFKSKLTSLYVFRKPPKKRKLPKETDPSKKYPYITPEAWKQFKSKRLSEEFRGISDAAAKVQSNNIYPHRMSRGGYRRIKKKLEEKLKMKEVEKGTGNDDDGEDSQAPTVIKRGDLWIEGRLGKEGECLNSETEKKIEEIHVVNEMVKKGQFVPNGKDDELTKALGTKEHYGRVRGIGGRVGHKQYFGQCKRKRGEGEISAELLEKLTQQITEKVRAEIYKDMEHIKTNNGNASSQTVENDEKEVDEVEMNVKSGNDSHHDDNPDPFDEIPEKGCECDLVVDDVEKKKVALGRVFKNSSEASVCHGKAIGAVALRVCVYVVVDNQEETELPLPTDEFATLGDAIGSFLLWPKNLITLRFLKNNNESEKAGEKSVTTKSKLKKQKTADDSINGKNVASGKSKTNEPVTRSNKTLTVLLNQKYNCRRFMSKVVSIMADAQVTDLYLSEDVLGSNKKRLRLVKDDLSALLNMGKLHLSVIETFIGYLCSVCDKETYGFISPELISSVDDDDQAVNKICKRMKDLKPKRIFLAPYYDHGHWMLLVIDVVERNQIYWFDSLGNSAPSKLKTLINSSVRIYGFNGGPRMSSQTPTWLKTLCARQQGEIECGYYIMRYMLEIVTRSNPKAPIEEVFKNRLPYSQEEIDEVRDLWADYFLNV